MNILVISNHQYPQKFDEYNITTTNGQNKIDFIESKLLEIINSHNKKLNVEKIEYADIGGIYKNVHDSQNVSLIVEEQTHKNSERDLYENDGYTIIDSDDETFIARRILVYVIMSPIVEGGRNTLISQQLFPIVIDYMYDYINSPSFAIANHPFMFINLLQKTTTSNTIARKLAGTIAMGFDYVTLYDRCLNFEPEELTLKKYICDYYTYNQTDTFETPNFDINFQNKTMKIKTNELSTNKYLKIREDGYIDFNGSSEKFYWMELIPTLFLSIKEGFNVDYKDLVTFYNEYSTKFTTRSDKIERFNKLIKFIIKQLSEV